MLDSLTTESRNPASEQLDSMTSIELVELIGREDATVAEAVAAEHSKIAEAIDVIADRLARGGRLIYVGAGTSGRLGVLDAAECPPTFNTAPEQVVGVIAGGPTALTNAVEGAEDNPQFGKQDLKAINVSASDCVVGIATSGRTPYVLGALEYARSVGAYCIGLACNRDAELATRSDLNIAAVVGPEIVCGSTRMKAGTATKMVLNMLSTGAMIRLGKTYGDLMVDLRASNSKLTARAIRITSQTTSLPESEANALLQSCNGEVKTAILSHLSDCSPDEARRMLAVHSGRLKQALDSNRRTGGP